MAYKKCPLPAEYKERVLFEIALRGTMEACGAEKRDHTKCGLPIGHPGGCFTCDGVSGASAREDCTLHPNNGFSGDVNWKIGACYCVR